MAAVLLTLGLPLAVSVAAAEQQRLVIDRIDDTARFAWRRPSPTPPRTARSAAAPSRPTWRSTPPCTASGKRLLPRRPGPGQGPRLLVPARRGGGPHGVRRSAARPPLARSAAGLALAPRARRRRLARGARRRRGRRGRHRLAHRRDALAHPAELALHRPRRGAGPAGGRRRGRPPHRLGPAPRTHPGRGHPRHRGRPDALQGRRVGRAAGAETPGALLQRDGGQRRGRAGAAARLRRGRLAPTAQPARRPAAAHRTARPGAARGQRGDRRRPHRGQTAGPGP